MGNSPKRIFTLSRSFLHYRIKYLGYSQASSRSAIAEYLLTLRFRTFQVRLWDRAQLRLVLDEVACDCLAVFNLFLVTFPCRHFHPSNTRLLQRPKRGDPSRGSFIKRDIWCARLTGCCAIHREDCILGKCLECRVAGDTETEAEWPPRVHPWPTLWRVCNGYTEW